MTRIVIFANGDMPDGTQLKQQLRADDRLIGADGGTRHALALGLMPHVLIGDFDSLSAETVAHCEAHGAEIQRHPTDKDKTDLALALDYAMAADPAEIIVVTALGGRLDQMMANILLLAHPQYLTSPIKLVDGLQTAQLARGPQQISLRGQVDDTLSLIPLTPQVTSVTLTGVRWPLTDVTLQFGSSFTVSNRFTAPQASITLESGLILIVHIE